LERQPTPSRITPEQRRRIESALKNSPSQMTLQLARQLNVPEVEIIRALPDNRAVELNADRWEELFRAFEELGDVHVIVSNSGVTCEVVGGFGGFSTWGDFFNVQSPSLDLHIRTDQLESVFAVEKPSHMNGVNTLSFQFFGPDGAALLKVFLSFGEQVGPERVAAFSRLREKFRK
jgi:putative heme utilization carrier protein HutX